MLPFLNFTLSDNTQKPMLRAFSYYAQTCSKVDKLSKLSWINGFQTMLSVILLIHSDPIHTLKVAEIKVSRSSARLLLYAVHSDVFIVSFFCNACRDPLNRFYDPLMDAA